MRTTGNQRSFDREPFHGPPVDDLVLMRPDGTTSAAEVRPFDLSPRGIGFRYSEPLAVGSLCQFTVNRNGVTGEVTGRVTRCQLMGDGEYAVGVKFLVVRKAQSKGAAAKPGLFDRLS